MSEKKSTKRKAAGSAAQPPAKQHKTGKGGGRPRVCLAYSGGLDTSCILAWLIEQGYDVVCFIADVGQVADDLAAIKTKALKVGAVAVHVEDLRREFVTDYVFPLLRSGAVYEGKYLLGTSIARPLIAKAQVEVAHKEGCIALAHGATGKGNDQVRFELSANALDPHLETIAPWRDPAFLAKFKGRQDLLQYAEEHKIEVTQTKAKPYSTDENLFHISYESGILEDPGLCPPADMFLMTNDPVTGASSTPDQISLEFKAGDPVKITNHTDGTVKTDPLELFLYLNDLGKKHGIGRVDIVENRFVGMKSRGVYETPGGTIVHQAHMDLEGITMDREVRRLRDMMAAEFARLAYNGFWFSPEMEFLMTALNKSQEFVDGTVRCLLYRGNVFIQGRESPYSRYNASIASMDELGDYNQGDAQGFIRLNSLRLRAHGALLEKVASTEPKRLSQEQFIMHKRVGTRQ